MHGAPPMGGMPPQMGGGYGAPPMQQPGQPMAAPPQMGAGTMQSVGSSTDSMDIVPGKVGGPNPIVTVLLIVLTCGIYGIYLLIKNRNKPAM